MDKLHVWPCIPVRLMRLVCVCYLWCVSLSQWEWTWMSGWLLGLCYSKQCAQSARLSVWKKTRVQIFFACIVAQTLLGVTPGLFFLQISKLVWVCHFCIKSDLSMEFKVMQKWQMLLRSFWSNWKSQRQPFAVAVVCSATRQWRHDKLNQSSTRKNLL